MAETLFWYEALVGFVPVMVGAAIGGHGVWMVTMFDGSDCTEASTATTR